MEEQEALLSEAREVMGNALEGLGRWEEALGYHESWRASGHCGNCNATENARRIAAVSSCRYRVGLVDEALEALWKQCSAESKLLGAEHDPVSFALYAEFSVREGRVDKLREQYATLPEENRQAYARVLEVAEAFAADDAAAIVRTVCNNPDDPAFCCYGVIEVCGRMLDECGPGAVTALAEALKGGGWEPIELAGHTHLKELLPLLRERVAGKPDKQSERWLAFAIPRLEACK